eukprot:m.340053 g.340053  ORF g.340053 m.340053 type:complete len:54 (-) comp19823_c3_seq12:569-730(-)
MVDERHATCTDLAPSVLFPGIVAENQDKDSIVLAINKVAVGSPSTPITNGQAS